MLIENSLYFLFLFKFKKNSQYQNNLNSMLSHIYTLTT